MHHKTPISLGTTPLTINDVYDGAYQLRSCVLTDDQDFADRIHKGTAFLDRVLEEEGVIYGVTTGYGDSVIRGVPMELVPELPVHLSRFHGCGMGRLLDPVQARAVVLVRMASLCQGVSGVSMELMRLLEQLLKHDIMPVIPEEGSVGASGDLTPLSYIAAVLIGERQVYYQGHIRPTCDVFEELDIAPLVMRPKEALAIMNGTSVMTALAVFAYKRAEYMARLLAKVTAMSALVLKSNPDHFDERLFQAKPHPGQVQFASWVREDLGSAAEKLSKGGRLQERYSIRCAPHVVGVLLDMLPTFKQLIETEMNSANDNPLIDPDHERILHGGHFYGGHIAFVMDSLKNLVANMADLMDRQMALMVDVKFNNDLPPNLSGSSVERQSINHGLKAVQIGMSAWTAEALKLTMPASVFSRSTECHNQDKVSMGTIAARDCIRVLELSEQVLAGELIAVCQGLRLRIQQGLLAREELEPGVEAFLSQLEEDIPFLDEDRPLESVLHALVAKIQGGAWVF